MSTSEKKQAAPIESWGRTWMVVTGASMGFGALICKEFAPLLGEDSLILGLARTLEGLQQTKALVQAANPTVKFELSEMDLERTSTESITKIFQDSLAETDKRFDRCVMIHNGGSLGKLDFLRHQTNSEEMNAYFNCNLCSVFIINAQFLSLAENLATKPKVNVINISSLCATLPIKSWGLYCTGKAARAMLFKVLALEEKDIDILSYSPGPLKGEMQVLAREKSSDPETKEMFVNMHKEDKLLDMKVSVEKLIYVLRWGKYSSGESIDYYDEI